MNSAKTIMSKATKTKTTKKPEKKLCKVCNEKTYNLTSHRKTTKHINNLKKSRKQANNKQLDPVQTSSLSVLEETEEKDLDMFENGASKEFEYMIFLEWCASPRWERGEIQTQQDFAKEYKVAEQTLSKWKRKDDFKLQVMAKMKEHFQLKAPDVMGAMYTKGAQGDVNAAKLYFEYIGEIGQMALNVNNIQNNQFNLNGNPIDNVIIPKKTQQDVAEIRARWRKRRLQDGTIVDVTSREA